MIWGSRPGLCRFLMVLLGMVCAQLAAADVYKYRDADGHILLTDKPMRGMQLLKRYSYSGGQAVVAVPAGGVWREMQRRREALTPLIEQAAFRAELPPALVHAVVRVESAYRSDAVSSKGAVGLMQLMPGTAARYGVSDSRDPAENLAGGTSYLRDLLAMFDGDLSLALAGYNAGENAVVRYGRQIPPFNETQNYVRKVIGFYEEQRLADQVAAR